MKLLTKLIMKLKFNVLGLFVAGCIICGGCYGIYTDFISKEEQNNTQQHIIKLSVEQKVPEEPLIETVKWMMEQPICRGKKAEELSEAKKAFLSAQIDRVINKIGGLRSEKEAFIWLICKESTFHNFAKSPVSALGLTQMMLPTAQEAANRLKMGKIIADDLYDPEISLTLGYSHFQYLSSVLGGNLAKISASYNGGMAGATMKSLKTGGLGAHETDSYVASLYNTMEELRIIKEKRKMEVVKN